MCLSQIGEPYDLVLPRVILGPLGPSHTSESVFPCHHCTMKSISVRGFLQKDINENMSIAHRQSLDPPTEKETRWDVLALDTIRFRAFKGLINSKSCISCYFVCKSKQLFEITDRPHHPLCLRRCQPMMNSSCRDSGADLFEFHSSPELNG
jgi:hypothetical protein